MTDSEYNIGVEWTRRREETMEAVLTMDQVRTRFGLIGTPAGMVRKRLGRIASPAEIVAAAEALTRPRRKSWTAYQIVRVDFRETDQVPGPEPLKDQDLAEALQHVSEHGFGDSVDDDSVIEDAAKTHLMTEIAGWVVLTDDVKDGPPKWQPDWDGQVHTDKQRAENELAECLAAGNRCVLAEVRVVPGS